MTLCWCHVFQIGCVFVFTFQARSHRLSSERASEDQEFAIEHHIHALPKIQVLNTVEQPRTNFTGIFHSDYSQADSERDPEMSLEETQAYLSYEIAWPSTGRRLEQIVLFRPADSLEKAVRGMGIKLHKNRRAGIENLSKNNASPEVKNRGKREIFGIDNRINIPKNIFVRRFPFSSVVKVSTGCTGTLVSPRHVLTAAHCIHNQKDYVKNYKNLRVGFIKTDGSVTWLKVNSTYVPNGWVIGNERVASKFDYSLLKLERRINKAFFKLGISEDKTNGVKRRIHFTSFEDDKPANTLWYRSCFVMEADSHVLYHRCDAKPGSSGAGVYLWDYDVDDKFWERKLIGVFSGNRWRYYNEWWKTAKKFNAAIRINSAKYTQICKWMGSYASNTCKKKYYIY